MSVDIHPTAIVAPGAQLGEAVQALCFLAGANSVFYGDHLLTTGNPEADADSALFARLGLHGEAVQGRRCAG